jgi:hypothetical protein
VGKFLSNGQNEPKTFLQAPIMITNAKRISSLQVAGEELLIFEVGEKRPTRGASTPVPKGLKCLFLNSFCLFHI